MGQGDVIKYLQKKGLSTSKKMSEDLRISQGSITDSIRILIITGEVERIKMKVGDAKPVYYYRLVINE
jgi:predicted transcriptional regulator